MADIGYIRVSTVEQNTDRQLDKIALDRVFEDKASGSSTDRPQLQAMLNYARSGDTIHVHSIDRLARNLRDLENLLHDLNDRGIHLQFHKEALTFKAGEDAPAIQKLMLQIMGAVADFERAIILERQAEGITKAKERGVYANRTRRVKVSRVQQMKAQGLGATEIARQTGISRGHVYRLLNEAA
jgi:DNA invertase Pin-like site-specific DNA recombinase